MTHAEEIATVVIRMCADTSFKPEGWTTRETRLEEDLGLDSLDIVELAMDVEDEFHIEVKDRDLGKFSKVGDIIDYVLKLKGVTA